MRVLLALLLFPLGFLGCDGNCGPFGASDFAFTDRVEAAAPAPSVEVVLVLGPDARLPRNVRPEDFEAEVVSGAGPGLRLGLGVSGTSYRDEPELAKEVAVAGRTVYVWYGIAPPSAVDPGGIGPFRAACSPPDEYVTVEHVRVEVPEGTEASFRTIRFTDLDDDIGTAPREPRTRI